MMIRSLPALFLFVIGVITPSATAVSPDTDREQLIAGELARDLDRGVLMWLETGTGEDFPAIYYEAFFGHHETCVILLHGLGAHPDWPDVIGPLRRTLPSSGWPTLSIQLPLLAAETPVPQYGETLRKAKERIYAARNYLSSQGFRDIVLLGYGFGAATGAYYLATEPHHGISAFIGVSMMARKFLTPALDLKEQLRKIAIPVLDIYGSQDMKIVTSTATDRRLALKSAEITDFRQHEVTGANHYYVDHIEILARITSDWLKSTETLFRRKKETD